ncbi:MAG TPA: thioredoxin-like domain-containing protein [Mycobacteriales bacterium]|nr:thioredoxin-like domain-containing protein [Mycobacteriales bacterium]
MTRVRAPRLAGRGGWLNTGGIEPDLRGRFVLLDFWTFCCVNCLHVLEELRPLEERFGDVLTVVGVHSPKFVHEADHDALVAAVERYAVHHPVLDDPDLETWKQFAVRAWPTLVLVDPEGYVVHVCSGEGHVEGIGRLLPELVAEHEARGTLRRGNGPYVPAEPTPSELSFPGKAMRLPDGRLLVADSSHDSVVVLEGDAVVRRYPGFLQPQGMCLYDGHLLVADSGHHTVVSLDLESGELRTVAGTGRVWRPGDATSGPALEVNLSTPWDVEVWQGEVVVAMAGTHQLHALDAGGVRVLAGTTGEGLRDGDALAAYLAQPSGLAAGSDRLWFVDAETSALRWYREGQVGTAVGAGLFDFGHRDGPAAHALLQHPLGVTVLPDGSVAVSDTYNGAVRRYDPFSDAVSTLMSGLAEPTDAVVDGDGLLIVESGAHRVTRVPLPQEALVVDGVAQRTRRPPTDLAPGQVTLRVVFTPPPGQKLDASFGPATRLTVSGDPVTDGSGTGTDLERSLVLQGESGVLHVAAFAASCDVDAENPACHVTQQDWGIPVRLVEGAPRELTLVLNGLAP